MDQDAIITHICDTHSGGSTALFPNRFWQFEHNNHTPTDRQKKMFAHWAQCAEEVKRARKGRRLILVHNGDAIDGVHHSTLQIVTRMKNEQIDIHLDLMDYFMQKVDWNDDTDQLFYVLGTEVHTEHYENIIGHDLGAVQTQDGLYVFDELRMEVNGKRLLFVHHGPNPGKGHLKGNAVRNWLKRMVFEKIAEGDYYLPHYVFTGHFHDPYWEAYTAKFGNKYHRVECLTGASWQWKTRYSLRAAPVTKNKIGLQYVMITREGLISDPIERLMVDEALSQTPLAAN